MQGWQLLTASKTITIHASESQAGAPIAQYNPHRGIVNCAVYNHTGKVIASCGQDGKIALHSAQRCQDKLLQLTYHSAQEEPSSINCCLFSPKSKFVAAGSVNSTVKVWDMKYNKQKQQALHKLKGHAGAVTSLAWLNGEQIIASSSTSGDILLHDVSTGAIRDSLTSRFQQGISNIKVSEGQGYKRLGACTTSGSLMVWDVSVSTKKPIYTYEDPKKSSFTCLSISQFSPVLMVCSSSDSSFVFMDINERKVIKTICTEEQLTSIAFNDDGQMLATGGMSGGISIYDLRKIQTPILKLQGHDTPIKSVCFGERQKDKDKQKEKLKAKDKDYGNSSNYSRPSTQNFVEPKQKVKVLTPVISSNKQTPEQEKGGAKVVRNLAVSKKQQIGANMTTAPQQPQQVVRTVQPVPPPTSTIIPSTVSQNANYTRSTSTIQPYTNVTGSQQITSPQLKALQQRLMGEQKNMQMRMNQKINQKVDMLHLEMIRQMQIVIQKITSHYDKKNNNERELLNEVKRLKQQNENLKKRTF